MATNLAGGAFGQGPVQDALSSFLHGFQHGPKSPAVLNQQKQQQGSHTALVKSLTDLTASINKLITVFGAGVGRDPKTGRFTSLGTSGGMQSNNPIGGSPSSHPANQNRTTLTRMAAVATLGGMAGNMLGSWGNRTMDNLTTMDYSTNQISRYIGPGYYGNLIRNTMYKGFNGGLNAADYAQGTMSTMNIQGYAPGSSQFGAYQSQVNSMQQANPMMGLGRNAQALGGFYSNAGAFRLRMAGINPYVGGSGPNGRMSMNQIANSLIRKANGGQMVNSQKLTAELENGGPMQAYLSAFSPDQQQAMITAMQGQVNGGTRTRTIVNAMQNKQNAGLNQLAAGGNGEINAVIDTTNKLAGAQRDLTHLLTETGVAGTIGALKGFTATLAPAIMGLAQLAEMAGLARIALGKSALPGIGGGGIGGLGGAAESTAVGGWRGALGTVGSRAMRGGMYAMGGQFANAVVGGGKLGTTLADAGTGAAIGSMILPGVGTAVGAGFGAVVGAAGGFHGNSSNKTVLLAWAQKNINSKNPKNRAKAQAIFNKMGGTSQPNISGGGSSGAAPGGSGQKATGGGGTGAQAVMAAEKFLGTPYQWGGSNPQSGFDCSGLTQYAYSQIGVNLPRTSQAQEHVGKEVARSGLQVGDLVFYGEPAYHVGMYLGGGKMIDAPHTGADIRIENLWGGESHFRRVVGTAGILQQTGQNNASTGSQNKTSMGAGGGWAGGMSEAANLLSGLSAIGGGAGSTISAAGGGSTTVSAAGNNAPSSKASGNLAGWEQSALKALGLNYNTYSSGLTNLINHESSGNPRAINLTDSNAKAGHPSKGLMQTIDSTFNSYAMPGHTDIWNPVDNIIAGVKYIESRYGLGMLQSGGRKDASGNYIGYALGSRDIQRDEWARVHQGEMVFQKDTADAFREWARSAKGGPSGGGVSLNFGSNSIVVNLQTGDTSQARKAATMIVKYIQEDDRLQKIASGT